MNEVYMRRCFELALRGASGTAPNPMVGALLVYRDRIIGEGWHRQYGGPHAEVHCFDSVAPEDRPLIPESVLYVSLEPCAHFGKTPPCAELVVRERPAAVVIANRDPFPKVQGRGIDLIRAAGIGVHTGLLEAEGRWLNRRFFTAQERQRPYIILKWAQSADGFIAPADRKRTPLSDPFSQALSHRWRTEEPAILVGTGTALHDDPSLTARHWPGKQPLRIALDRSLRIPKDAKLYDGTAPTWIVTEREDALPATVTAVRLAFDGSLLPQLMQRLLAEGHTSVLVEGGAQVHASFLGAGWWDEARVFHTPVTIGRGIAAPQLIDAELRETRELGADRLSVWLRRQA